MKKIEEWFYSRHGYRKVKLSYTEIGIIYNLLKYEDERLDKHIKRIGGVEQEGFFYSLRISELLDYFKELKEK